MYLTHTKYLIQKLFEILIQLFEWNQNHNKVYSVNSKLIHTYNICGATMLEFGVRSEINYCYYKLLPLSNNMTYS